MSEQEKVSEELQKRVSEFLEGYKKLVEEHKVDLASYPVWMPEGNGSFKCVVQSTPVDISNQPTKSPSVTE